MTEKFHFFWRSDSPFSQWHKAKFEEGGIIFNCAEQWMMYQKAIMFYDHETVNCILYKILDNNKLAVTNDGKLHTIDRNDIIQKDSFRIGPNPFNEKFYNVRAIAYSLDSIVRGLNLLGDKKSEKDLYTINNIPIQECNWNPFVYNSKGEKEYYQRPFVWTEKDNQLLIQSIYEGIDCGKILVRMRSWEELEKMQAKGETELSFRDIVDGKQRLYAIQQFMIDKYPDLNGDYYSDLSHYSQYKFDSHQLFSYSEMPENSKDSEVIGQFLKMNFCGVPQSEEHINFVREINKRF
jgi:hypothetical protein